MCRVTAERDGSGSTGRGSLTEVRRKKRSQRRKERKKKMRKNGLERLERRKWYPNLGQKDRGDG